MGKRARHLGLVLALAACTNTQPWEEQPSWESQDIGSFPYHPLIYHLDLSILSYKLYAQTLVWPFDPYYEEIEPRRDAYMARVREWGDARGPANDLDAYRGPGSLGGFPENKNHDPILFRYGGVNPWASALSAPQDSWMLLQTPDDISREIGSVHVCYRRAGGKIDDLAIEPVRTAPNAASSSAANVLLAFEGGTGDKGDPDQPPSQSLMGFVLVRQWPDDTGRYDVHVVFRGSRSGSLERAALDAHWDSGGALDKAASGNPDWITDMGYGKVEFPEISTTGEVHRGFAHAMAAMLPGVMRCLTHAAELRGGAAPESIYVTGHSLGGALAQHFVSAVLQGKGYGPAGAGPAMPEELRAWPWPQIKLISFSSPRAGDLAFARELTANGLQSDVFSTPFSSKDKDALPPADPFIVKRLLNRDRPAGFRVLHTEDLATTEKVFGGKHVGKSVYVNPPTNVFAMSPAAHEPATLRTYMEKAVRDSRTPKLEVWKTWEMEPVDKDRRGTVERVRERAATFERLCRELGVAYDKAAFDKALALRLALEEGR